MKEGQPVRAAPLNSGTGDTRKGPRPPQGWML